MARTSAYHQILNNAVVAVVLGVNIVGMASALAALIFNGAVIDGRATATASFALGGGVAAAWLAYRSRTVPLISIPQDAPAIVLVAVVSGLLVLSPDLDTDSLMALLAVSTMTAGVAMVVLGRLGLSETVRYLPTVVVQGFVAGTGWLLFRGGLEIAADRPPQLWEIDEFFQSGTFDRWIPALALAAAMMSLNALNRVAMWAASTAIVVATAVFYAVVFSVSSPTQVQDDGWLIGPFETGARPSLVTPDELAGLPWGSLLRSLPDLASLLVVTLIALLLNLSALETIRRRRIDASYELTQAGLANIAISTVGSVPVFHGLGNSVLAEQMGVRSRWVGVAAGGLVATLAFVGIGVIGYVPLFVAGGILMAVGLGLLLAWVRFLLGAIGFVGRAVSVSVVVVIGFVGIIEGVLLGLVLACGVFVFRYGRVDPIRRMTNGLNARSRVDRTVAESEILDRQARRIRIVELQGYFFFASATRLVDTIRTLADDDVSTIIVDLRFVTGVEPGTAAVVNAALAEMAEHDIDVVASGSEPLAEAFFGHDSVTRFSTLDAALGFVEDHILDTARLAEDHSAGRDDGPGDLRGDVGVRSAPAWLDRFPVRIFEPGATLMGIGDPGDNVIYLLSGTVSATAPATGNEQHRMRRTHGPSWIGEIGFLTGSGRTANVVAETRVECVTFDADQFEQLRADDPHVAHEILRDIAATLADRTATLTSAFLKSLD